MRNDAATWAELEPARLRQCRGLPGPRASRRPADFGICADVLAEADLPCSASASGTRASRWSTAARSAARPEPVHGRISAVFHDERRLFDGLPQDFTAVRYHSLRARAAPRRLQATAWTDDGVVMGAAHRERPHVGRAVPSRVRLHRVRPAAARELPRPQPLARARARVRARPRPPRSGRPRRPAGDPPGSHPAHRPARRPGGRLRPAVRRRGARVLAGQQPRLETGCRASPSSATSSGPLAGSSATTSRAGACAIARRRASATHGRASIFDYLERQLAGLAGAPPPGCPSTSPAASSATSATR